MVTAPEMVLPLPVPQDSDALTQLMRLPQRTHPVHGINSPLLLQPDFSLEL